MKRLTRFLAELRRRRVFRVAAWYAAFAWVVIQFAATVFPNLELPAWTTRLVIVAMLLGFPVALALAWIFQLSAEGIDRRPDDDATVPTEPAGSLWRSASMWLALVAGALLGVAALQGWRTYTQGAAGDTAVVAILPFDNLSANAADAYLADGLQDETITRLAQLKHLTVISRSSVDKLKRETRPAIPEIAQMLGATHIVEGSVQRADGRVRVRVQLILGSTDAHLWAHAYERPEHDLFALESDLAQEITSALDITLSGNERERIGTHFTEDPVVYDLYLRALAIERNAGASVASQAPLQQAYQTVLDRDPRFAPAHARLSMLYTQQFAFGDRSQYAYSQAFDHVTRAIELAPALPDAVIAMADYHLRTYDYASAERDLVRAAELAPSNAEVRSWISSLRRRQGAWDEANRELARAIVLAPQDAIYPRFLIDNLLDMRRYGEASAIAAAALRRMPESTSLRFIDAYIPWQTSCDDREIQAYLQAPDLEGGFLFRRTLAYSVVGNWSAVIETFQDYVDVNPAARIEYADMLRYLGRTDEARNAYLRVVDEMQELLSKSDQAPGARERRALPRAYLAYAFAALGRREEALPTMTQALNDLPVSQDAVSGDLLASYAIRAYALLGERELLFAALDQALTYPTEVHGCNLQRDPDFAQYEDDQRLKRWIERDRARVQ